MKLELPWVITARWKLNTSPERHPGQRITPSSRHWGTAANRKTVASAGHTAAEENDGNPFFGLPT